jgi:hypothetical protein
LWLGGHISVPGRGFGISVFITSMAVSERSQERVTRVPIVEKKTLLSGLFEHFQAAVSQI